jgi:hypothetical protein
MKDEEWRGEIEAEIANLKNRMAKLDGDPGMTSQMGKTIELDINWPEADISGLHFNAQKTHGVFERKEDGNYYSRDILILSARDTDEATGRDLLSEYLDSEAVREAFQEAMGNHAVRVFLPKKNQGVKKYNGVSWCYWLRPRTSGSAVLFCYSLNSGHANGGSAASGVGGCAPAFRVVKTGTDNLMALVPHSLSLVERKNRMAL